MRKRLWEVVEMENNDIRNEHCCGKTIELHPALFKDNSMSKGGVFKEKGQVLREHSRSICRPPSINCRIQSFGRICKKFDERRTRWVNEMAFGGILHLVSDMHVPRQLSYWIMTRIDPLNRILIAPDGHEFPLSKNQVRWILGTPSGNKSVPSSKMMNNEVREKVHKVILQYGSSWKTKSSRGCGSVYISVGIPVTSKMMDRLEGNFGEDEEEEFKTLFLILLLHMVMCPTQSPRLATDLIPAVSCVKNCKEYDWSDLVLKKLMASVSSFARRFYATGYAGGCGGCAIFAVIFYHDRLNGPSLQWDVFPRIKVWTKHAISMAAKADRTRYGDYGRLGVRF
ncbi:uncharacterized protein LOC110683657 [Chenopodium quinoa]|uniref:uncharacterized protein LOC110683657 n=1 Tax=Chenopodium quinoa TaxID=63459 RepID=UPI000B7859FB|nr:uncharacterized protein LOC110683657 [Chenopodium quinoa]